MQKLLIVDDNENNRAVLCDALEAESYEVFEAANGEEALEKTRGIQGLSLGNRDVLAHLEHTLKESHGDQVWIWRMQLRCEPEGTGSGDGSSSGESSSEESGEGQ